MATCAGDAALPPVTIGVGTSDPVACYKQNRHQNTNRELVDQYVCLLLMVILDSLHFPLDYHFRQIYSQSSVLYGCLSASQGHCLLPLPLVDNIEDKH